MRRTTGVVVAMLVVATATALLLGVGSAPGRSGAQSLVRPMLDGVAYLGNSGQPPSQAACNAVGRRCFNPTSMASSYNYAGLHAAGNLGQGETIAVVDSFGATTVRQDLGVHSGTEATACACHHDDSDCRIVCTIVEQTEVLRLHRDRPRVVAIRSIPRQNGHAIGITASHQPAVGHRLR